MKLLVASPKAARTLLESLAQQGHGTAQMFVGRSIDGRSAASSVDAVLSRSDITAAGTLATLKIATMLATVKQETG